MITKKELLERLSKIRILHTCFPVYSYDGIVRETKGHTLLTYTPWNIPMASEEYALNNVEMQYLISDICDYVVNSVPKKKTKNKRKRKRKSATHP